MRQKFAAPRLSIGAVLFAGLLLGFVASLESPSSRGEEGGGGEGLFPSRRRLLNLCLANGVRSWRQSDLFIAVEA